MATEPYPRYYAVNDRPVKLVELPTREVEVLVYDFASGELVRDMSYASRIYEHGKDIDKLDEDQFDALIEQLRSRR
jgi:hypothetical protein